MKRSFVCYIVAMLSVLSVQAAEVALSKMDLSKAYQQYGGVRVNASVTGEAPFVKGERCEDVIGVQAKSLIKLNLRGAGVRFSSGIGIADSQIDYAAPNITAIPLVDGKRVFYRMDKEQKAYAGVEGSDGKVDKGNAVFRVLGDGKELFSASVAAGESAKRVDLKLNGVGVLELLVEPGEDGPSGDHALWIHPVIEYFEIPPVVVDTDFVGKVPGMDDDTKDRLIAKAKRLPEVSFPLAMPEFDWLISPEKSKAFVGSRDGGKTLVLANDLVARVFRITPNLATTDIINRMTGETMLRAVSPEGTICIDGVTWNLGGLGGQPERGYIKAEWIDDMVLLPNSFTVEDFEIAPLTESMRWARSRWALNKEAATGVVLTFTLRAESMVAKLHYTIYDTLPVICKSLELVNESSEPVNVDAFKLERLAFTEPESPVGGKPDSFLLPNIHIESDYAFGGFTEKESDHTEKWVIDPDYTSQCNYPMQTPCILEVAPPLGPDYSIAPGAAFASFHVYEMPFDSTDRERKGLFTRRMYRTIAPWTTENPIFLHLTSTNPSVLKTAVDQCADVGYEMIILSFGSGLNMEDVSEANYTHFKELGDYSKSKGIEMGGYSLLASRWISDEVDVINPETGKRGGMIFGSSPCLCSDWGYDYFDKIKTFFEKTGMTVFEHDGSYPGDVCASTTHSHHNGLGDSQWKQFQKITELYRWMCENGIYINVPDFYILNGSTKVGIGYRETNWSLPRDRQVILGRQVNFNGTWERMASSCWTFVPLVQYHGGGAAATLEPLSEHLDAYKMHMMQNYGAGVQACYRGPRLYDTPETRVVVLEVINWYKKYRRILNSDMIHLRKADARDWDGFLHVNPQEKEKGLAMFFNPLDKEITRSIKLPLYYTGLTKEATIREQEGKAISYELDRDYSVLLKVTIPAHGYTWYVIE